MTFQGPARRFSAPLRETHHAGRACLRKCYGTVLSRIGPRVLEAFDARQTQGTFSSCPLALALRSVRGRGGPPAPTAPRAHPARSRSNPPSSHSGRHALPAQRARSSRRCSFRPGPARNGSSGATVGNQNGTRSRRRGAPKDTTRNDVERKPRDRVLLRIFWERLGISRIRNVRTQGTQNPHPRPWTAG
jgi:hypothetical protein